MVSHSHALAAAAARLAGEMVPEQARPVIELAAGLDETTFGTDATEVAEAITRADSPEGVLVLLDLGSAVLSAEMALELVDPDLVARTQVSSAPLVEGLVAAVVTASGGADLGTVAAEARRGLLAKRDHVGDDRASDEPVAPDDAGDPPTPAQDRHRLVVTVDIPHGLHARPAARLVAAVAAHPEAQVQVRNVTSGAGPVDGRSVSLVATLGVREGQQVELTAGGSTAEAALDALRALADDGFGDRPAPRRGAAPDADTGAVTTPVPLGSGLGAAIGPALRPDPAPDRTTYRPSGDLAEEQRRLDSARQAAGTQLAAVAEHAREVVGAQDAAIFDAHRALLDDPALTGPSRDRITDGAGALEAWHGVVQQVAATFAEADGGHLRDRAQDVRSVGGRVERNLLGVTGPEPLQDVGILVVDELDPTTATLLDPRTVLGVITIGGGTTGHGVIVASARGVPVLTGAGEVADVPHGTVVAFDERTRELMVDPTPQETADVEQLLARRAQERDRAQERAGEPAITRDGRRVAVEANVSSAEEAARGALGGAEGSGLVRTEVLFGHRSTAPTVAEQAAVFTEIARAMTGPVTIRTWDTGADKPLPFWDQPAELNPFLGVRGVRSFRQDATLLLDQLEAVCRVAREHPLRVMFPMVSTVAEVDWALARLAEAAGRLGGDGLRPESLQVGIMIEIPAAALRVEALTTQLDFVSIGTNDLTQYTLAAERGNPALDALADPVDPAVLALVDLVCREVTEGVRVGVCGEAAGDPAVAALLVGLGVDGLSVTTTRVPDVKARLRAASMVDLQDLAERALRCDSAAEVRALLGRAFSAPPQDGTGC